MHLSVNTDGIKLNLKNIKVKKKRLVLLIFVLRSALIFRLLGANLIEVIGSGVFDEMKSLEGL